MIPHERSLVDELKDKPFAIVGVNTDGVENYVAGAKDEPVTWRSFDDGHGGPICRDWNIHSFPSIFVLDQDGVIRHRDLRGEELATAVRELVAKAEAAKPGAKDKK
jgi:alkyl hydroperoxide reductase subunit AhpC